MGLSDTLEGFSLAVVVWPGKLTETADLLVELGGCKGFI